MDVLPRVVWMPGGVRTEIHLDAAHTGGAFCMLLDHPPAGWSIPPHLHQGFAETIHVLEGEFEIVVAERATRLLAGQTAHVPADAIHATANVGSSTGRRIVIFSPAGMEEFFREAGAESVDSEVDLAAVLSSAARHGWRFAG
jgi:quercetin dioxygenase-like cupin family protein